MKIDDFRNYNKLQWEHTEDAHRKMVEKLAELGIDPGNFYQELEMSSLYVNAHRDISYTNIPVNLHSHNYYEILYIRHAADIEYLIGAHRYRLQKGDIIFIPPGISHRPIMPEILPEPYERDVLWLSQEYVDMMNLLFSNEQNESWEYSQPIRTLATRWEFLGDLFRAAVVEEEEKRPDWDAVVMGMTMTVLANLRRAYIERTAGTMMAEKPELLDRIAEYIDSNYTGQITLDALAKRFYVSSSTISHQFKQRMGVSLYSYITQRRLIAAKELIARNVALESVAEQSGFHDYSTFYRAFKHEFGISPKQYRQRLM